MRVPTKEVEKIITVAEAIKQTLPKISVYFLPKKSENAPEGTSTTMPTNFDKPSIKPIWTIGINLP